MVDEQSCGGVDGERLDGVESGGAGAESVAAVVAFDLVAEVGEFVEVALEGAVADAELAGEVGGCAGGGGEEGGQAEEAVGLVGSAGGHGGGRVRRGERSRAAEGRNVGTAPPNVLPDASLHVGIK